MTDTTEATETTAASLKSLADKVKADKDEQAKALSTEDVISNLYEKLANASNSGYYSFGFVVDGDKVNDVETKLKKDGFVVECQTNDDGTNYLYITWA